MKNMKNMEELNYKVGDCFVLKNGSVWKIIEIDDYDDDYPILAEVLSGDYSETEAKFNDKEDYFTEDLNLYYYDDETPEKVEKYSFTKFVSEKSDPEYFI